MNNDVVNIHVKSLDFFFLPGKEIAGLYVKILRNRQTIFQSVCTVGIPASNVWGFP